MEEKVVTISLKTPDWSLVLNALANRPYGEVAAAVAEIQRQAAEQLNAVPPAATEAPPQE